MHTYTATVLTPVFHACLCTRLQGASHAPTLPCSATHETLVQSLNALRPKGQTALGPALLVATAMAIAGDGTPGGLRVLLCTDGCSNVGLAPLDNLALDIPLSGEAASAFLPGVAAHNSFYSSLAVDAREAGALMNVLSIEGEHSNLQALGVVADITGGGLYRVQPNALGGAMQDCTFRPVLAARVNIRAHLHGRCVTKIEQEMGTIAGKRENVKVRKPRTKSLPVYR